MECSIWGNFPPVLRQDTPGCYFLKSREDLRFCLLFVCFFVLSDRLKQEMFLAHIEATNDSQHRRVHYCQPKNWNDKIFYRMLGLWCCMSYASSKYHLVFTLQVVSQITHASLELAVFFFLFGNIFKVCKSFCCFFCSSNLYPIT